MTSPPRPAALSPRAATIPDALRKSARWVVWGYVLRDGKWTKPPRSVRPPHPLVDVTDATAAAGRLHEALTALARDATLDGIGFALFADDQLLAIDLDNCRDPATGAICPDAQAIIDAIPTYWELSPSGRGVHAIGRGTLAGGGLNQRLTWADGRPGGIEVYDRARYITVTGHHLAGTPAALADITAAARALVARYRPPPASANGEAPAAPPLGDEEVLARCRAARNAEKFAALWAGAWQAAGYASQSEADAALIALLAFYTRDPAQLDRLFRRSGLMRAKWDARHSSDGRTYGELTIAAVLARPGAHGTPPGPRRLLAEGDGVPAAVPPFPTDVLPPALQRYVAEAAASLHCPPELVAVPLLTAVGVALGHAAALALKADYCEQANLFSAVVARPGERKSPALGKALAPLQCLQQQLTAEYERARAAFETRLAQWESQAKRERGPRPREPVPRSCLTTDATTEALGVLLQHNKGLLLHRDELSGWIGAMNQYRAAGRGADRQFFLSAWSRAPLKIDRKHQPPLYVASPFLAVTGGVQPDLLVVLGDPHGREDGFLDRLLWAYPDPLPPGGWSEATVSEQTQAALGALCAELFALQPLVDLTGQPLPRALGFTPAARARWAAWYSAWEQALYSSGLPARLRGWWAKLPAQVARLALILALAADPASEVVEPAALEGAIALGEYFAAHALRVYAALGQRQQGLPVRVLALLHAQGPLPTRELYAALHGHVGADRLRRVLEELEEAGLVTRTTRPSGAGGGRPATVWQLVQGALA